MLWAWAPGGADHMLLPDGVGFGALGDSGCEFMQLQVHYDNPLRRSDLLDSSGIRVYYTEPRGIEAGMLQLGDGLVGLGGRPLQPNNTRQSFACDNATAYFDDDNVTVFHRLFHMHRTGQRMVTRHYAAPTPSAGYMLGSGRRHGLLLRADSVEFWRFDQQGVFAPASTGAGFLVRKGDTFLVDCYYYRRPSQGMLFWGGASFEEMCIDFIFYYPKQRRVNSEMGPMGACAPPQRFGSPGAGWAFLGEACAAGAAPLSPRLPCLAAARRAGDALLAAAHGRCRASSAPSPPDAAAVCGLRRDLADTAAAAAAAANNTGAAGGGGDGSVGTHSVTGDNSNGSLTLQQRVKSSSAVCVGSGGGAARAVELAWAGLVVAAARWWAAHGS